MSSDDLRVRVLLAMQVALLGTVGPNMRAVLVSWSESDIRIRVIFDSPIAASDEAVVSEIETEMMSHFPDHGVSAKAEVSSSAHINAAEGEAFVFLRA
jgi:hypothetical protein